MTFANSLDPDLARQNVGPDLGPNCLTLMGFLNFFFKKADFERKHTADPQKKEETTILVRVVFFFCV